MELVAGAVLGDEHVVDGRVLGEARQPLFERACVSTPDRYVNVNRDSNGLQLLRASRSNARRHGAAPVTTKTFSHPAAAADRASSVALKSTFVISPVELAATSIAAIVRQEHDRVFAKQRVAVRVDERRRPHPASR